MAAYQIMTINVGNNQDEQTGIKERIEATEAVIKQHKPDILFVQDLTSQKGLNKLQLDEEYESTELPYNQSSPYTSVLWKKETIGTWKPSKKFVIKEKPCCDKSIVDQRFSSVFLTGPNGEKLCVVSYHGFHKKPKFHGEGAFTKGEKKKLTRDFLNCLKEKNADAIIIGGSFNLPASETPRESIFKKAQDLPETSNFFMFTTKLPNSLMVNVTDVKALALDDEQMKSLKHAPVLAQLKLAKK